MTLRPTPTASGWLQLLLPAAITLSFYACKKDDSANAVQANMQTFSGNTAVKQTDGLSSACSGCYVADADFAVDSSKSTNSFLYVTTGDNAFVQQKLEFSSAGKQGDSLSMVLSLPEGFSDGKLFSNVELATGNENSLDADRRHVIGQDVALQQLPDGKFLVSWVAAQSFNTVEVRLYGVEDGTPGLNVYFAQKM